MKATFRTFAATALGLFAATAVADTYTLTGDEDWSNRAEAFPASIDLNGHNLTVTRLDPCTITDTNTEESGGELHVNVAKGATLDNTSTTLAGFLKLVKDGAGTLTVTKTGQTYSGGTEVAGGMLTVPKGCVESNDARLGTGASKVTVDSGATVELNASNLSNKPFVLAGGTVQTSASGASIGAITLTANSTLHTLNTRSLQFSLAGDVDLCGYELKLLEDAAGAIFVLSGSSNSFKNGTVNITGGGFYRATRVTHCETADFILNAALRQDGEMWVRDLTVTYNSIWWQGAGSTNKSKKWCIKGTYTPKGSYIYNFEMQDGSTLNLRDKTDVWVPEKTLDQNVFCALMYANNATINVIPPKAAPFNPERKIVSWSDAGKPTNLNTLTFKLAPGYDGSVVKKDDGLYYYKGMTLLFR